MTSPQCDRSEIFHVLKYARFRRFVQWSPRHDAGGIVGAILESDEPFETFSQRYDVALPTLWLADAIFDASPDKGRGGALGIKEFAHAFYAALPDHATDRVWRVFAENAILRVCHHPTEQLYLRTVVGFSCSNAAIVRAQAREHLYYCKQVSTQHGASILADWAVESCVLLESRGPAAAQDVIYNFIQALASASERNVVWVQRLFLATVKAPMERKPAVVTRVTDAADIATVIASHTANHVTSHVVSHTDLQQLFPSLA